MSEQRITYFKYRILYNSWTLANIDRAAVQFAREQNWKWRVKKTGNDDRCSNDWPKAMKKAANNDGRLNDWYKAMKTTANDDRRLNDWSKAMKTTANDDGRLNDWPKAMEKTGSENRRLNGWPTKMKKTGNDVRRLNNWSKAMKIPGKRRWKMLWLIQEYIDYRHFTPSHPRSYGGKAPVIQSQVTLPLQKDGGSVRLAGWIVL